MANSNFVMDKCCFCALLKMGSLIIAIFTLERRSLANLWAWGTTFLMAAAIVLGIVFILLLYVAIVVRSYALTLSGGAPVVAGRNETHVQLETVG